MEKKEEKKKKGVGGGWGGVGGLLPYLKTRCLSIHCFFFVFFFFLLEGKLDMGIVIPLVRITRRISGPRKLY